MHAFTVTGTERVRFENLRPITITGGSEQLTFKNGSAVDKAYMGTSSLFGSAGTDDLRIRSEAGNIIFGFTGSEIGRFAAGVGLTMVAGTSVTAANFTSQGNYANGGFITKPRDGTTGDSMMYSATASTWAIYSNGADRLKVDGAGNTYTLGSMSVRDEIWLGNNSTQGVLRFGNGQAASSKYLWYDGTNFQLSASLVVGGNISSSSDARLKSNIRPLTDALAIVSQLNGKRFDMYGKPTSV
jgi:hypothetical protein